MLVQEEKNMMLQLSMTIDEVMQEDLCDASKQIRHLLPVIPQLVQKMINLLPVIPQLMKRI